MCSSHRLRCGNGGQHGSHPLGVIKINVDATLSKNVFMASAAAIARDEDGRFMGALALVLWGIVDPEMMESITCREGISSCKLTS
jgi:hypothetical protein